MSEKVVKNNTIDAGEVKKFADTAETWWDVDGTWKVIHPYNEIRVRFIVEEIAKWQQQTTKGDTEPNPDEPLKGFTVLDVGCGGGVLSETLAKLGADVTGIDPAAENIAVATKHANLSPWLRDTLRFQQITAEDLLETKKSYDLVVSSEVLEHVADPAVVVASCASLVKPGGSLIFTTWNRTVDSFFLNTFAERISRTLPVGTHEWRKFVTPQEIESYLPEGFTKRRLQGFFMNLLTFKFYYVPYTRTTYGIHFTKKHD